MHHSWYIALLVIAATLFSPDASFATKKWTFMVYACADNNLEPAAIDDMNEMETVGSTADVNVVIQVDRIPGYDATNGNWTTTRRYYITKDSDPSLLNSTLIADLGEKNMGDPAVLRDFVEWGMSTYPAEHYFLVVWDHGSGWEKRALAVNYLGDISASDSSDEETNELLPGIISTGESAEFPGSPFRIGDFKATCADETNNDILFNDEAQSALSSIPRLDIIGFDACLMGMVEVAYEFRDRASYLVASEESEPGDGWPYDLVLSDLVAQPTMSPATLCSVAVVEYGNSQSGGFSLDETMSAVDLIGLGGMIEPLDTLCSVIITSGVYSEVTSKLNKAESFGDKQPYYDLYDIADIAADKLTGADIKAAAESLKLAIDNVVLANWHEGGHPHANGLAIYFPQKSSSYDVKYESGATDFAVYHWVQFLKYYWNGPSATVCDIPEPNDYLTQAGLPLDTQFVYSSYISSTSDRDWWLINTGIGETIKAHLTVPANANFDMYLYNKQGIRPLASSTKSGNGVAEDISFYTGGPANFYLKVVPYGPGSALPYELSVNLKGQGSGSFQVSFDDGNPAAGYYCTTSGDVLGVSYDLPVYPMKVNRLWIYFLGIDGAATGGDGSFYLLFYDNRGYVIDPFALGALKPAATGWNYLELSDADIKVYSNIFVGLWYDGVNTPTVGYDSVFRGKDYYYSSSTDTWSYLNEGLFFRLDVSYPVGATDVDDRNGFSLPSRVMLDQNYPNPFNNSTIIQYSLPRPSAVEFDVLNILGETVRSENLGLKPPGTYSQYWDGTDRHGRTVPSGVYFYRIQAGDITQTKKMVLLK
jgi:hypothetical protein